MYDLSPIQTTHPINVSTRGPVQTGDNVMIGGFIISGNAPKRVIIRAIGPSLREFSVSGVLGDPTLELHDGAGKPYLHSMTTGRTRRPQKFLRRNMHPITQLNLQLLSP